MVLRGDILDNLLGVLGVGEKMVVKLIMTYGGFDGIFVNVDAQMFKLKALFIEHEAWVCINFELMLLCYDVLIDVDLD